MSLWQTFKDAIDVLMTMTAVGVGCALIILLPAAAFIGVIVGAIWAIKWALT